MATDRWMRRVVVCRSDDSYNRGCFPGLDRSVPWPLVEEAWGEGEDLADALLGSSDSDEALAQQLVESYVRGAEQIGVSLDNEEMRVGLLDEARFMLVQWRAKIIRLLEECAHC